MEVFEVTHETYGKIINNPFFIYGNADFNHLNEHKCDSLHYLLFKEDKYRLGIIGGIKGSAFLSASLAPFGGFIYLPGNSKITYLDSAIDLLVKWAKAKKLKAIQLMLPPPIYDENFISKQIITLFNKKFYVLKIELNYIFSIRKLNDNYLNTIGTNAKYNLNKALKNQLTFYQCKNLLEKRIAYQIIKLHKQSHGQSLEMSWEEMLMTTTIIDADFFITYNADNFPVAAAIVFHINQSVVQIIYWGDNPKYSYLKTMNYLAYKIFEYYHENYKFIDLGASFGNYDATIDLSNFNESIGCDITTKFSFIRSLT